MLLGTSFIARIFRRIFPSEKNVVAALATSGYLVQPKIWYNINHTQNTYENLKKNEHMVE